MSDYIEDVLRNICKLVGNFQGCIFSTMLIYHNLFHFFLFQFDLKVSNLKEEYEKQISTKDEKLKIMKKQIAEALTGSSL